MSATTRPWVAAARGPACSRHVAGDAPRASTSGASRPPRSAARVVRGEAPGAAPRGHRRGRREPVRHPRASSGGGGRTDRELLDDEFKSLRAARGVVTALGVDYGTRRAGIAVSVGGASPRPVAVVPATPPGELIDAVVRAAVRERADVIVVGLPKPPRDFEAERAEERRRTLYSALVDVGDLANECFDASDVAESLGADEMKRRLAAYSMKIGGRVEERAARLWALVEAGGDLDLVPAGAFVGGEAGKRDACARARKERVQRRDGFDERTGRRQRAGGSSFGGGFDVAVGSPPNRRTEDDGSTNRRGRAPVKMHVLARRFAENLADAVRDAGLGAKGTRVVMVDESATSAEADLIASTARGGRGLKDRPRGAHLDDIAAGVLLDRYFAGSHGDAEEIPPANSSAYY